MWIGNYNYRLRRVALRALEHKYKKDKKPKKPKKKDRPNPVTNVQVRVSDD